MRTAATGLCVALAVAWIPFLCGGWAAPASAQPGYQTPHQGSSALITLPMSGDPKGQLLAIIDPQQRTLAVYQIDAATGEINFRCARNLTWDLLMMEFNAKAPLPGDIRALLEQK